MNGPLDHAALPAPVLDAEPALVDLYWTAWDLAWAHVTERDGVAQSPYLDEGQRDSPAALRVHQTQCCV